MSIAVHKARKNSFRPDRKLARARRDLVETNRRPDVVDKKRRLALKQVIGWLVLLPACLFTIILLAEFLHSGLRGELQDTSAFRWFSVGAVFWLALFGPLRNAAMIVYVFGHEWTHMLTAKLFRAQIYDWSVTTDGGWVDTDRSNTLISLSPYFVPIYTLVVILLHSTLGLFFDLGRDIPIGGTGSGLVINPLQIIYLLVGITWAFHVTYTLQTLRGQQSDLMRNGEFFSVLFIMLCNVLIVLSFLIIIAPDLTWAQAWECLQRTWDFTIGNFWHGLTWTLDATMNEVRRIPDDIRGWGSQRG